MTAPFCTRCRCFVTCYHEHAQKIPVTFPGRHWHPGEPENTEGWKIVMVER